MRITPGAEAPVPRTRPRNRRTLISAAAADLFYERGFDQVSTADVAGAVGIGASALYRHYPGKQQLLAEVLLGGITPLRDLLDRDDVGMLDLCDFALEHRRWGLLWQREGRHLAEADRSTLREHLAAVRIRIAAMIRADPRTTSPNAGPFLASLVESVLTSPSFHHLEIPRDDFAALLLGVVHRIMGTPVASVDRNDEHEPALNIVPRSRREALYSEATRLFAERGYAGVSIDEIAASVGIAGPSIYNHVATKTELLRTSLDRGSAYLMMDLAEALSVSSSPDEALSRLVRSYLHFAVSHHDVVTILMSEVQHLEEHARLDVLRQQREYVLEWVQLLTRMHPDADPTTTRIRVHAVMSLINDAARSGAVRRSGRLEETVQSIGERALLASED